MIDADVASKVWDRLCRRFNHAVDQDEFLDYVTYLDRSGLDTTEFVAAAEGAWATREFFPRPADFLAGQAAYGWTHVMAWARTWSPHLDGDTARAMIDAIPPRARRAMDAIGGIDAIRKGDIGVARSRFFDAFNQVVVEDAAAPVLAAQAEARMLQDGAARVAASVDVRMVGRGAERVAVEIGGSR